MADPWQLSDLRTHVQFLTQDSATDSTTTTNRDNCINDAYIDLAGLKGFWRLRTTTYTSSSTPALTDNVYQYNLPSDFSEMLRIYYRISGVMHDIDVVSDSEWLERSQVASGNKGDPSVARITQTSATQNQIEFSPRISSAFITTVGTITLEYFIEITRLSAASDEPILPANLRHHIAKLASLYYALAQGDSILINHLTPLATLAKAAVLKHDLTRTGRPRQLRPRGSYWSTPVTSRIDYGQG